MSIVFFDKLPAHGHVAWWHPKVQRKLACADFFDLVEGAVEDLELILRLAKPVEHVIAADALQQNISGDGCHT